jgi:hypothetical protein
MQKLLLLSALLIGWSFSADARAALPDGRTDRDSGIDSILASSEQHFLKGESCLAAGNLDGARREFDVAVDSMIDSGVDVRSDSKLYARWREMIEKIDRYQLASAGDAQARGWGLQEFEGRPAPEPGEIATAPVFGPHGQLAVAAFQQRFAELGAKFRAKYGRDFVVTGADHEEHRRLYGSGSAYDIRVRDLSPEQIRFILATGDELGLRVKDFSTWEKVQAHNARVVSLGLPRDTMATAAHIHIDREASPARKSYVAIPAVKTSPAQ